MGTGRYGHAGTGIQTAALAFGGNDYTVENPTNKTEEYDGSVWSAGGNLNEARTNLSGAGTQTAGLGFGGYTYLSTTEEYTGGSPAGSTTVTITVS
jgi:hypothetical protein